MTLLSNTIRTAVRADDSEALFEASTVHSSAGDQVASREVAVNDPQTTQFRTRRERRNAERVPRVPSVKPRSGGVRRGAGVRGGAPAVVAPVAAQSRSRRRPFLKALVSVTCVLAAAGGVLTMALPATAVDPQFAIAHGATSVKFRSGEADVQQFESGAAAQRRIKIDKVSASTPVSAAALAAGGAVVSGVGEAGSAAYPWPTALTDNQGGGLSPLNYYYRECVDYVAWRLNVAAGTTKAPYRWTWSTLTPLGGEASDWKANWVAKGWKVSSTPVAGAVAWWGSIDHVAYVQSVNGNGTITIDEYNWGGMHSFDQRIISVSNPEAYLYYPGTK